MSLISCCRLGHGASARELPVRADEVAGVAVGDALEVVLVLGLGFPERAGRFEGRLERLRVELGIPALSAAIVANGSVAWARGFGQADLQSGRLATDTTSYHLASLTKVFAVISLMRLVEAGRVSLDDPVSKYGISMPASAEIRVRHLLNHTSESTPPGTAFRYNGDRFALRRGRVPLAHGEVLAEAELAGADRRARLLLTWRRLAVGLELIGDRRDLRLVGPREWYEQNEGPRVGSTRGPGRD